MSAQSDAEWAEDDARHRDQMIGRLMLEREQMLQELHECALSEDQVRAIHSVEGYVFSLFGEKTCNECRDEQSDGYTWPCPTIRALEGR